MVLLDHGDHVADGLLDRVQPDQLLQPRPRRALEVGRIRSEQVRLRQGEVVGVAAVPLFRLQAGRLTPRDLGQQVLDRAGVAEAPAAAALAQSADGDAHVEPIHGVLDLHLLLVPGVDVVT